MKIWCKWPLWDNIVLFQCALENKDVSIILRKGGGYPFLFAIVFGVEIPGIRDAHRSVVVTFGVENKKIQYAIDQEVIDLGDVAIVIQAEIMQYHPVFVFAESDVQIVSGIFFLMVPAAHHTEFFLYLLPVFVTQIAV